jgi:hypothetical protein
MSVNHTHEPALDTLLAFVEGRLGPTDFERALQTDPSIEATLKDDPDLPGNSYVGISVFHFLLELDLSNPGGVLDAQGAVSQWLTRHSIAHSKANDAEKLYGLILAAQPAWLDVDPKWMKDELIAKSGGLTGNRLKKWLRERLLERFRYVSRPPRWLQKPSWPIGAQGPLVFLGQFAVKGYFHDDAVVYVFHDPASGECKSIVQGA